MAWKDNELEYCRQAAITHGNASLTHDPKTVAAYFRLQASAAYRDGEWKIAARLGAAATAINEDARNNHVPDWNLAAAILTEV